MLILTSNTQLTSIVGLDLTSQSQLNDLRQATYNTGSGLATENQKTFEYEMKAFKSGHQGSETMEDNFEFFESTKGSISMQETKVSMYTAQIANNNPPPFDPGFILQVQKMASYTAIVSY